MKLKKIIFITIPFLLTAAIIGYTPDSKKAENASYNEKKEKYDMNKYLDENHAEIDLDTGSGFSLMDEDIVKSDVILTGEYSNVSKNYQVKLSLLKYLNKKYNVRYLLENISYSQSSLLNEYLKSGDVSKLDFVVPGRIDLKEFNDFCNKLKEYNDTLPESKKIIVIGINLEYYSWSTFAYINSLIPESEPISEIKPFIKAYIENFKTFNNKQNQENYDGIIKTFINLHKNMEDNPAAYESYLGNRYFDFKFTVDNFVNTYKIYNAGVTDYDEVESIFYNNFKRIYHNLPIGKYFGQFKMEHVYQNTCVYMGDTKRFAMYLNGSDSPVGGRVLSIAYAYQNCMALTDQIDNREADVETEFTDLNLIQNISKSDITLFKLNGDKSLFSTKSYFVTSMDNMPDTDYFKYIILIKNSKAAASF
ncbi:MAG: hypothetical protein WCQ54_02445 [Clostridiaceae bacterium]